MKVEDILNLTALLDPKVIAGSQGLKRNINWFHIVDIPQLLPWLNEGDVVFSSGYALHLSGEIMDGMIEGLDKLGVCGLFLAEDIYLHRIPLSLTEAADRLGFPIVSFAAETKLRDVTHQLSERILKCSDEFLQLYIDDQRKITQIVGKHKDPLPQLMELVGGELKTDVLLLDSIGHPLYPTGRNGKYDSFLKHFRTTHLNSGIQEGHSLSGFFKSAYFYRALCCDTRILYFVVLRPLESLETQETILLNSVVPVITLFFTHISAPPSQPEDRNVSLLERILTCTLAYDAVTEAKICEQGWRLGEAHIVMIVQIMNLASLVIKNNMHDRQIREFHQRLFSTLEAQIYGIQGIYPVLQEDASFMTLIKLSPNVSEKKLISQCYEIALDMNQNFDAKILVGMSSVSRKQEILSTKLLEAHEVLSTLKMMNGPLVASYEQVSLDIMLNRIIADMDIRQSYRAKITVLEEYDALHTSELIDTLRVFSSHNGNISKTARAFDVHRNTIQYRLQKIEELTGILSSSENNLLNISILLKIYDCRTKLV